MEPNISNTISSYSTTFSHPITKLSDFTNSPRESVVSTASTGQSVATIVWAIINLFLFLCTLGGNTLTIIAIRTCRRLRSVISNLFILSLAISDLGVGVTLPYHLAFYMGPELGKSHGLCLLRFFLIIFLCSVSIFTLIAIAVDRYIAIVYALHYRRYMTRRVAYFIITFNWIAGASVAAIPMFWNHWNTASQCEFDEVLPRWYMAGIITPGFILIWIVMLLVYWRIMREASKHSRQLRNSIANQKTANSISDWKSVQIVVFIMGCFSICWLPYFVVACAQIFGIYNTTSLLYKGAFTLAMTNSLLNPIIYSWKNSNFRKAFSLLLRCKSPNIYNLEASHGSIRSHDLPRHGSSNSRSIVPNTPLNLQQPQQDCLNFTTVDIESNRISTVLSVHDTYRHRTDFADEETEPTSEADCTSCVICKNILRKSTQLRRNLKHKTVENNLPKCTSQIYIMPIATCNKQGEATKNIADTRSDNIIK